MMSKLLLVGGEALLPSYPEENFAIEGGSALSNLFCHLVNVHMLERIRIDTFVRDICVSEAVTTSIGSIVRQDHIAKLVGKGTKVGLLSS
jgi:hypothetical protein